MPNKLYSRAANTPPVHSSGANGEGHSRSATSSNDQRVAPTEKLSHGIAGARGERSKLAEHVRKSVKRYIRDLNGEQPTQLYDMVLGEIERPLLEVVMRHTDHNQSKAARMLGINRNTLRKKLELYQIGHDRHTR